MLGNFVHFTHAIRMLHILFGGFRDDVHPSSARHDLETDTSQLWKPYGDVSCCIETRSLCFPMILGTAVF